MNFKALSAFVLCLCMVVPPALGQTPEFPTRPIKLILPFAPGGASDLVARILAEHLSRRLQQAVVVDNKAGAGGAIGAEAIAAAVPDGYTIGIAAMSTHVVIPSCNPHLKYDPITSFTPIAMVADMPNILVGRPGAVADFDAFRKVARERGASTNYGIPGNCTLGHVVLEHLNHELGANMTAVPYRGSAATASDMVAGRLDFMSDSAALLLPYIEGGQMKPLAVAWPARLPGLKDVPTYGELGLPALNVTIWYGVVGPAGMPRAILDRYEAAIGDSMADPVLQARFDRAGMLPVQHSSPAQFGAFLAEQYRAESRFIRARRMTAD